MADGFVEYNGVDWKIALELHYYGIALPDDLDVMQQLHGMEIDNVCS